MNQTAKSDESEVLDQHTTLQVDEAGGNMNISRHEHDVSNINNIKYSEESPNNEGIHIGDGSRQTTNSAPNSSTQKKDSKAKNYDVVAVIFLQFIVLALMILLTMQYSWLHNVPNILSPLFGKQNIEAYRDSIAKYNFVGVNSPIDEPSIFAVALEVAIWSLAGVLARSEYYLSQIVIRKRQFNLLESISKLISDGAMGIAIAIAVVLLLRATEFVNLSLQNANVASIAAISFILGFYHEDTRHLLGSFRKKISESVEEAKGNKDAD
jgi:hypothetical protein